MGVRVYFNVLILEGVDVTNKVFMQQFSKALSLRMKVEHLTHKLLEKHSKTLKDCFIVTWMVENLKRNLLGIALVILTNTAMLKMIAVLYLQPVSAPGLCR